MSRRTSRSPRMRSRKVLEQLPYGPLRHDFAPLEVLGEDALEAIHDVFMSILEGSGLRVLDPEARCIFAGGGFEVDEAAVAVRLDRAGVLDLAAKAPARTGGREALATYVVRRKEELTACG